MNKSSLFFAAGAVTLSFAIPVMANPPVPQRPGSVPAAMGTLEWNQRQYFPTGCMHNGNRAICRFAFSNQGAAATLQAWYGGYSEMWGVQFVDDAHVPHNADTAYFLDRYGSRQGQLFVSPGDRGMLVIEFPDVDPRVGSGSFSLRNQMVGTVAVATPPAFNPQQAGGPAQNQNGYPQQGGYQPQNGMPGQQAGYPQQQPVDQGGMSQQQAGYPPQNNGYPQQNYGYQPGNGYPRTTTDRINDANAKAATYMETGKTISDTAQAGMGLLKSLVGGANSGQGAPQQQMQR